MCTEDWQNNAGAKHIGDPDPEPHKVKISEGNMESGDQEPDNPGDTFDEDDEVVGTRLGLVRMII